MKLVLPALIIIGSQIAFAGQFVQRSLYSTSDLVVGTGRTLDEATRDAKSAIPRESDRSFYEPDSNVNSPAFQCLDGSQWTEQSGCASGSDIQIAIPLRHVSSGQKVLIDCRLRDPSSKEPCHTNDLLE